LWELARFMSLHTPPMNPPVAPSYDQLLTSLEVPETVLNSAEGLPLARQEASSLPPLPVPTTTYRKPAEDLVVAPLPLPDHKPKRRECVVPDGPGTADVLPRPAKRTRPPLSRTVVPSLYTKEVKAVWEKNPDLFAGLRDAHVLCSADSIRYEVVHGLREFDKAHKVVDVIHERLQNIPKRDIASLLEATKRTVVLSATDAATGEVVGGLMYRPGSSSVGRCTRCDGVQYPMPQSLRCPTCNKKLRCLVTVDHPFVELLLLAVKATYQRVRGIGSRLVDLLKELVPASCRTVFVDSDYFAIGFYEKNGFTTNMTLPWKFTDGDEKCIWDTTFSLRMECARREGEFPTREDVRRGRAEGAAIMSAAAGSAMKRVGRRRVVRVRRPEKV